MDKNIKYSEYEKMMVINMTPDVRNMTGGDGGGGGEYEVPIWKPW